jgi:DNA-binding MarR family transcriptional regulator/GNAT superfamily N-acetyltransferase
MVVSMENDFISGLGMLSFVSRLKRLSEIMIHDGRRLYKELGMDIEPNWYLIFKLLQRYDELTVTEIAEKLGFAHPSVISIVNKMIKAGYLEEKKCGLDGRRRLLKLTAKAEQQLPEFEAVWNAGAAGVAAMLAELDALNFLDQVERKISEKGFKQRTMVELDRRKEVEIVQFEPKYAADFARLNYEWIEQYFTIEDHDHEMLDDPVQYIIKPGGQIFLALVGGEAVGTVALINDRDNSFELAKMAVTSKYRGLKIGEKLMNDCLDHARRAGKAKVFLLSNRKLIPAISLYRKFGFEEVPLDPNNLYQRTDIQMELILKR